MPRDNAGKEHKGYTQGDPKDFDLAQEHTHRND